MGYGLGVDLGIHYTAAAVNTGGRVEMLGLGIRAMQVPSVVFVRSGGEIIIGELAEQQGSAEPSRVVREFKRRIGDPLPFVVGGTPYSAQTFTAHLLGWVVGRATERLGGPPEQVCVTHPASWGPFRRDLLGQAIEMAGLRNVRTCTEPEAAAITYASHSRMAEGERVAVYDLGGGTFNAAVLVRDGGGFRLAWSPEDIEQLGGIDFDEAVFRYVLTSLGPEIGKLDDADPATATALSRLRWDCVAAKEVLSFSTDTVVPVALPGVTRSIRLTRGLLDDMLRPAIVETVAATRRALNSAGVEPGDLAAIVLVGGSSRIPLVSDMLSAEFKRPLALSNHPKHDIALGAAIRCGPPPTRTVASVASPARPQDNTAGTIECRICGFRNSVGLQFCVNCDGFLDWADTNVSEQGDQDRTSSSAVTTNLDRVGDPHLQGNTHTAAAGHPPPDPANVCEHRSRRCIFISYRRHDQAAFAGRLYDRLEYEFGDQQLFMDVDSLRLGADFVDELEAALSCCVALIVVIGKFWLNSVDASGNRRLDDPDDFVRLEIEHALNRKIRIIPILVDGASMPRRADLPNSLAPLVRRQGHPMSNSRFRSDCRELVDALKVILKQ